MYVCIIYISKIYYILQCTHTIPIPTHTPLPSHTHAQSSTQHVDIAMQEPHQLGGSPNGESTVRIDSFGVIVYGLNTRALCK